MKNILHIVLWLALGLSFPSVEALAQAASCTNPAGDTQCSAVGNPLNVITGKKLQRDVDLAPLPGTMGLEIVRYYNSKLSGIHSRTGVLGRGWRLGYETTIAAIGDTVQIVEPDGNRLIFARDPLHPSLCSAGDPANGIVETRRTRAGEEYTWRKNDGKRLSFDIHGRLVQILAPTGEFVSMRHDARGWLVQVTDPQGRSLRLNYLEKSEASGGQRFRGVQSIDTPVGRFTYGYGSELPQGGDPAARRELLANLVRVGMPDGTQRRYHFEDARFPTLLTGISVATIDAEGRPGLQRYATFGYDANAMAVLSTHAGGVDRIDLDRSVPGQTTLTNSLGQKTVYRYGYVAGDLRLQDVRGAGCSLCAEPNVRYAYDEHGRVTDVVRLDAHGAPLQAVHTDYDYYGRPLRIGRIAYRDGKPGAAQWDQRFEYAAGGALAPVLIARPSVVPGRERVMHIRYGDTPATAGLPVEIAETGYIPTYDVRAAAQRILRTVRYAYDGTGRRIETDGPLPNAARDPGPDNSDIVRTTYDTRTGLALRTVSPGGMVTEVLERDAALRPVKMRTTDGGRVQTATIRSNWRGQPEQVRIEAASVRTADGILVRTFDYRYDVQGRLIDVTAPGGLVTRFAYDAAGRMTHRILPDGSRVVVRQDTEGRIASEASYAGPEAADVLSAVRYRYDELGRVVQADDDVGMRNRLAYSEPGQVAELADGMGTLERFRYDDKGLLVERIGAAGTSDEARVRLGYDAHGRTIAVTDANGVRTERRYDDFGRKVFEAGPDRGAMLYTYDAAGRIVARIDEGGVATRYRYDHAGRLVASGADKQPDLVRYAWQGQHLQSATSTAADTPGRVVEKIDYDYDAFGQQVRERRWIARVDDAVSGVRKVAAHVGMAAGLTFVTVQEYDDAGRLVARVLPDGHRLAYRYAPADAASAQGRPGQLQAILFDDQVVVTDIAQTAAGGLTGYTNGNGVRQRIVLDARGRVSELQASASGDRPGQGALFRWWHAIKRWLSGEAANGGAVVYGQINSYDNGDRMTSVVRRQAVRPGSASAPERSERYDYDRQDRLVHAQDDGTVSDFAYDKGGNRVARKDAEGERRYFYQPGTNRLLALTGDGTAPASAWLYHPTGVPVAHFVAGVQRGAEASRRIVYNSARRPIAVYGEDGQPIARYFYNTEGQRVAKSVVSQRRTIISYSLYADQRLAATTDAEGRIRTHYVYLGGKPVAQIDVAPDASPVHRAWTALRTAGGLRPDMQPQAGDSIATVYAIHTDQLGTPQAVTDHDGRIVWQGRADPFGKMRIAYAAMSESGAPFEMALRLPGQVHDPETGLNQNYYRDYDPDLGRYVTADPSGLAGGLNPYAYAGSNPLTNVDPLGLYQSDVHFYMTYFLAIIAGMTAEDARMMALATQYVDNNPRTYPVNEENLLTIVFSPLWNKENLARYHFVLWTSDSSGRPIFNTAADLSDPIGKSPQLQSLLSYAEKSDANGCLKSSNTSLQFMGEFLHAFEDTFAHRMADNTPFGVNNGFGHGYYDSDPDYTYNHEGKTLLGEPVSWVNNADRTLTMEGAVYAQIVAYMEKMNYAPSADGQARRTVLDDPVVFQALLDFNGCRANEGSDNKTGNRDTASCSYDSGAGSLTPKIAILANALKKLGYSETFQFAPDKDGKGNGYDVKEAADNRQENLRDLQPVDYPAANLPKGK